MNLALLGPLLGPQMQQRADEIAALIGNVAERLAAIDARHASIAANTAAIASRLAAIDARLAAIALEVATAAQVQHLECLFDQLTEKKT